MAKIYRALILFLFLIFFPGISHAATLSIEPGSASIEQGKTVTVKVMVKTDTSLNAVSGVLSIPDIFSIESASKAGSVLNFWVTEPTVSKASNTVKFEGVTLGGFSGSSGSVVTLKLKALKTGSEKLLFKSGQILANDGNGTDITGNLIGAIFSVKKVAVTPSPKPSPKPVPEPAPEPEPEEIPIIEEPIQPLPSLKAPEIMFGTRYGAPAIVGTSEYPRTQVLITFVALDGAKIFIQGLSDVEGSFNIVVPNSLKHGTYNITAVMVREQDKSNSESSNVITVNIGNIVSDISYEIYIVFVVLVLLIIYLLGRIIFNASKERSDRKIKNQISQVEEIIHKSFGILREEMKEYDAKRSGDIKRDMIDAEKVISKKVEDME